MAGKRRSGRCPVRAARRASRGSRRDGGRSPRSARRRRRRPPRRRPAPRNSRSTGHRLAPVDAGELERGERRGRVEPVVPAGMVSSPSYGSSASPRTACGTSSSQRSNSSPTSERDANSVVVEVDVRHDGDLGAKKLDRPIRLVALDDKPAGAGLGIRAQLRHLCPDQEPGSRPSRSRTNAIIAAVVVFPCAPATTIESWSETSSARNSARIGPRRCRRTRWRRSSRRRPADRDRPRW